MPGAARDSSAEAPAGVIVDFNVGRILADAVRSLLDDGIGELVVVENGRPGSTAAALGSLADDVRIVPTGRNLGFGAGVNRGVAALRGDAAVIVVANPDTVAHPGVVTALADGLRVHEDWAIVGPTIVTPEGVLYPSVRSFPRPADAVGHALLGLVSTKNRFTERYRSGTRPDGGVDWVSGAFFAVRRPVFESLGGFDEGYFMFAEDMDLCWRGHEAGWGVGAIPTAMVSHVEGVARRAHPYKMLRAHHRSALRFANRTTKGPTRLLLPVAAVVLGFRLAGAMLLTALKARPQT